MGLYVKELRFDGDIRDAYDLNVANNYCREISELVQSSESDLVLGFDVEYGKSYGFQRAAIIQLCPNYNAVYIFHLTAIGDLPNSLREIIENGRIIKTGVGVKNDISRLKQDYNIEEQNIVDLSDFAFENGLHCEGTWSLKNLVFYLLKKELDKESPQRWHHHPLNERQLKYAAQDAYASFSVFKELNEIWLQRNSSICTNDSDTVLIIDNDNHQPSSLSPSKKKNIGISISVFIIVIILLALYFHLF